MTKPLWMLVREAFERKNYFPPSSELRDELVGIAIDYAEQKTAAARAEIERLTKERDEATSTVEPVNSNNLTLAAELAGWKQAARQMEAERDEALAQVAAAFKAAADVLFDHGDGTVEIALDKRLCCNGYQCGCQGATVGLYLQHLIRSLTPADAQSALEAYGRKKVREGMRRAAEIIRGRCPECLGTGVRDSGGVYPWGEPISVPCDCTDAILGGMETIV